MEPTGPSSIWNWVIANSAVIRDLGSIILAVLGIALLTWRSVSANRQARASQTQAEAAQVQISQAQHDSLVARYQRSADMLGNEGLSVRLGGIFGLCQLARDHPQNSTYRSSTSWRLSSVTQQQTTGRIRSTDLFLDPSLAETYKKSSISLVSARPKAERSRKPSITPSISKGPTSTQLSFRRAPIWKGSNCNAQI